MNMRFESTAGCALQPGALLSVPEGPLCVPASPAGGTDSLVRLSVVVPTYQEAENVREMIRRLTDILEQPLEGAYEIIVVDDDSPDGTWEIARSLAQEVPRVRVMRREQERGLSSAVIRGWQAARGDVLAVIDGDLQHPPEVTLALWREMERGADLAVGSRHVDGGGMEGWSATRRALSRGAQLLGLLLLPSVLGRVSDPMSGLFMIRRSAVAGALLRPLGYKLLIEVIARGSARRIREVGYTFQERARGESKVSARVFLEYLAHLIKLRASTWPLQRLSRFAAVGLSGVVVDMTALFVLSDPRALGWHLLGSKVAAVELAIVNNFLWNDAFTFRDLARARPGAGPKARRFLKFNAICGIGMGLQVLVLHLLVSGAGVNRYVANAIAIATVMMWNFWMSLEVGWRRT